MAHSLSDVVDVLTSADLTPRGFLANASNYTVLVRVGGPDSDMHAVYKPRDGERGLWDFPGGTLYRREVAAFAVSQFLGWGIVPPTVGREGPFGVGSVQQFVMHDPQRHYFSLVREPGFERALARIAYFDLLVNNADRKGSHILLDEATGELRGIDHGVTFNAAPKLRTVVWDLGTAAVEEGWRADVGRLAEKILSGKGTFVEELGSLLDAGELAALCARAAALREMRHLPDVPEDRRPYPWPPL